MTGRHEQLLFGRQPNDPTKPRARLTVARGASVAPPASADWLSQVPAWGMMLNDQLGDCTAAGAAHAAIALAHYGRDAGWTIPDPDVLAMYEAVSGYKPSDPSTDVGATLQDALGYWRATGVGGHKIAAFAQIDAHNLDLVRACIANFGTVYAGLNFPSSAMGQFNAGKPWSVVKRSAVEGGHCVPIGAYDASGFTCVTWGQTQRMDVAFYTRYFDEVWVPIDLDWLSTAGWSPAGLDTDALNADYQALTGQPGPFPRINTPTPAPAPADVDTALAAAVRAWLAAKSL